MAASQRSVFSSLFMLCLVFSSAEARDFLVGGKIDAWKIPSSQSESLNYWAGSSRFRIGDSLVWKFDSEKDSALQVSHEDYVSCNISNPIEEYNYGNTKVELDRSGSFFFISGAEEHCQKGQKLIVVVLSGRHRYTGISPAPSPVEFEMGPAVAPTSSATRLQATFMVAVGILLWGLF